MPHLKDQVRRLLQGLVKVCIDNLFELLNFQRVLQVKLYQDILPLINVGKSVPYVFGTEYDSGGAGVTTSVSDYSKFASALANGGVGMNGEQIISSGTIELLRTNQLDEKRLKCMTWSQLRGYGYGLGVRTMMNKAESGSTGSVGEFGWGGAAGATLLVDPDLKLSMFYTHHMLNPQETYNQPRLRNVLYTCLNRY